MVLGWYSVGTRLVLGWYSVGTRLVLGWNNAKLRAWYNIKELAVRQRQNIPINSDDAHPTLRLELSRVDESNDAYITAKVLVLHTKASFAGCMEFKDRHGQCMKTFDDDPNAEFVNSHPKQFQCLTGPDASIPHCVAWYNCFDADTREKLVTLLRGLVMFAPTTTTTTTAAQKVLSVTLASWQLFFPEVLGTLQAHAESMPLMRKEAAI